MVELPLEGGPLDGDYAESDYSVLELPEALVRILLMVPDAQGELPVPGPGEVVFCYRRSADRTRYCYIGVRRVLPGRKPSQGLTPSG